MNRLDFAGRTARHHRRRGRHRLRGRAAAGRERRARGAVGPRRRALERREGSAGPGRGIVRARRRRRRRGRSRAAREPPRRSARIDVLVCSAGITGPNTTAWDYPVDEWRRVFDVNLHGLFYCNRAVVPHDAGEELRAHRQHRVGGRQGRQSERVGVQRVEGRGDRAHQVARQGARDDGHPRQLRHAGGGAHGDLRPDDAAAHRLHAVEDPAGPLRHRRRDRRAGVLARAARSARSRPARCSTLSGGRATY